MHLIPHNLKLVGPLREGHKTGTVGLRLNPLCGARGPGGHPWIFQHVVSEEGSLFSLGPRTPTPEGFRIVLGHQPSGASCFRGVEFLF